jgi:type IV pilus assembly protein PilM
MKEGRSAFRGDLSVGGREFTEAIMEEGRVSFEEAETIKNRAWEKGVIPSEFASALEGAIETLVQEVKRSLSLYWTFAMEEQVSSIYLCGGGSMVPGLSSLMVKGLGVPVEMLDPLRAVRVEGSLATELQPLSPLLAIGAGLSLRRPDEQ